MQRQKHNIFDGCNKQIDLQLTRQWGVCADFVMQYNSYR